MVRAEQRVGRKAELTYINLLKTAEVLSSDFGELFKQFGITGAQYNVLRILRGAGDDGLPCQAIGERLIHRVPDVTRLVDRVEQAGWAERRRSTDDRRVVQVHLSESGRDLIERIEGPLLELHRRNFELLSEPETAELNRILDKVRSGIVRKEVAS